MHSPEHERRAIISYWESQSPPDDEVEHAEKVTLKPCVVGSGPIYGMLTPPRLVVEDAVHSLEHGVV